MPPTFSDEIKSLRAALGLRAVEAARRIGVARATLYAWESGEHAPDPAQLGALIRLYDCDSATELRLYRLRAGVEVAA